MFCEFVIENRFNPTAEIQTLCFNMQHVFNWLVPLGAFQSQLEFGNVGF